MAAKFQKKHPRPREVGDLPQVAHSGTGSAGSDPSLLKLPGLIPRNMGQSASHCGHVTHTPGCEFREHRLGLGRGVSVVPWHPGQCSLPT